MTIDFVHLHVHSEYSSLDGIIRVSELPGYVARNNMKAVAITDHGNLGGSFKFYNECKSAGVKPIIGIEAYAAENRHLKGVDSLGEKYYHLLLLAQNEEGYKNLVILNNLGNHEGFYHKGRLDDSLLEQYNKGLIATSTCLGGRIAQLYKRSSKAEAERLILYYKDLFNDRFFLELQDHPTEPEQIALNNFLLEVSLKYNIPPIMTYDCHYLEKDDGGKRIGLVPGATQESLHEQILGISTNSALYNEDGSLNAKRFSFEAREHWVKTPKDIEEVIKRNNYPLDVASNTVAIANMCTGEYFTNAGIGVNMPTYPDIKDSPDTDLATAAKWGLVKRFGSVDSVPKPYRERLDYELKVIADLGFSSYFLFVQDICNYAKQTGIIMGPGRGSAAGCLVSWALGITGSQLDPLKLDLYFERFLNPFRKSPPDVDLDFEKSRRHEIHEYVKRKYGENSSVFLGTYNSFKPKGIVRSLARIQAKPQALVNKLANDVPDDIRGKACTIEEAIEQSTLLKQYPEIITPALKMDRLISSQGVHASGFVIYDKSLVDRLPWRRTGDYDAISQFDMGDVEALGYIKFDFLGIENLDVINNCINLIRKNHNVDVDLETIDLEDPAVFDLICSGRLGGIFQLEDSLRNIVLRMQPRSLDEISVINAIGRPGPLDAGLLDIYLECRRTGEPPSDMPAPMAKLLKDTHYTFIYQEQIMRLAVELAGFSMPDADGLRKAIGKKKPEEMASYEEKFRVGATTVGILNQKQIDKLWTDILAYSDYCFNKAHSYAYSLLGYWECWLKCYYPTEFFTALMSAKDDLEKVASYISEARTMGISIYGPDINKSDNGFTVHGNSLYFGFESIKGLGKTASNITKARGNIQFKDFFDFMGRINRTKVTSNKIEQLILAGAFDSLGYDRQTLFTVVQDIVQYYKDLDEYQEKMKAYKERELLRAQLQAEGKGLGSARALKLPVQPTKPVLEQSKQPVLTMNMLQKEREVLGCFMSLHPVDFVTKTNDTDQIINIFRVKQEGKINGVLCSVKEITTKKGDKMAFLEVEDQTGRASVTMFPSVWKVLTEKPQTNDIVRIMYTAEDPESIPKKLVAKKFRKIQTL